MLFSYFYTKRNETARHSVYINVFAKNRTIASLLAKNRTIASLPNENRTIVSLTNENRTIASSPDENRTIASLPNENHKLLKRAFLNNLDCSLHDFSFVYNEYYKFWCWICLKAFQTEHRLQKYPLIILVNAQYAQPSQRRINFLKLIIVKISEKKVGNMFKVKNKGIRMLLLTSF